MFTYLSDSIFNSVKKLWGTLNNYGVYDDVVYITENYIPQDVFIENSENNFRKEIYLGLVKLSEGDDEFSAKEFVDNLKEKYTDDSEIKIIQELETFTQKYFPETDDPFFVPKISGCEYKNLVNTLENHFVDARHCLARIGTVHGSLMQCLASTTLEASLKNPFEIISNTAKYIYNHPTEVLLNGLVLSVSVFQANRIASASHFGSGSIISATGAVLALTTFSQQFALTKAAFPAAYDLNNLNSTTTNNGVGVIFQGRTQRDYSGWSVSTAGDVNNDGFADILIGAPQANPLSRVFAGETYLLFGHNGTWPVAFDLTSLNGSNSVVFQGRVGDVSGYSVSAAGDVNKDGFADMLIGADEANPLARGFATGETYLLFGHNGTWPAAFDLMSLNGSNGLVFQGRVGGDYSGSSVSAAGDVNKDGFADVLIGAWGASPLSRSAAGETYLLFGHNGIWPAAVDLATLNGSNGVVFQGREGGDNSGYSVSSAGDVNKDGFADLLIGAQGADPLSRTQAGETYLLFGHNGTWPAAVDLATLNGTNGAVFQGRVSSDRSGVSVSAAGDVNNDGFADILIGAYGANPLNRGANVGETYLLFGYGGVWPAAVDLTSLNASNGVTFQGWVGYSGMKVRGAGDVNNDGFADMLIGAYAANPLNRTKAGETYLLFGHNGTWPAAVDLATLNGTNGVVFQGRVGGDFLGVSISAAGDVDNDGFADILIGASHAKPLNRVDAGEVYLLFGHNGTWPATVDLNNLNGSNGVVFQGGTIGDVLGDAVSAAGDVNNDGFADILIGATTADPLGRTNAGATYLLFGHNGTWPAAVDLAILDGSNGVVFQGSVGGDASSHVSAAGDVNKDGFADMLIGAFLASPLSRGNAGKTYLLFGHNGVWPAAIDLRDFNSSNGVVFQGRVDDDRSGISVSTAGDVNKDGFADMLIGAYVASPLGRGAKTGETYLLFGCSSSPVLTDLSNTVLSYTENAPALTILAGMTVSDIDNTYMQSANVRISNNFVSNEDILEFSAQNGITGNFDSQTGILPLFGNATKADYQAALYAVTYRNLSDNPFANNRTISVVVNDGYTDSNIISISLSVIPVNDVAILSNSAGTTAYTENSILVIDPNIVVTDLDNNIRQAFVSFASGFISGEDILGFTNQNGINGSYNSAIGVLTLSGSASVANYQAALRSVTFNYHQNTPGNPRLTRTIAFMVNDGGNSNTITRNIAITLVNDVPILTGVSQVSYTENSAAMLVNSALIISDPDSPNLNNATVAIINGFNNSQDTLAFTQESGINGSYNNATGLITLSGVSSVTNYQSILRTVTYVNNSRNPTTTPRQISFTVNDGGRNSIALINTVTINPVNNSPLFFSADETIDYRQNDPAIVIASGVTLSDVDNTSMQSATIAISSGFVKGEDQLSFNNKNNISAQDSLNGVLMLSGNASIADYEAALKAVTYRNVATHSSESNRTISIQVSDGIANSNTSMRTINILPFNNSANPNINNNNSNNTSILLAILLPIAGTAICAIAGSLVGLYLWRRYQHKKNLEMELSSIRQNKFTIVGGRFELVNKINQDESLILEQQTGIKVTFVEGKKKTKIMLGQGQFGKLRLARVIETGQYVGVKKIKGDNQIAASEREASIQKNLSDLPNIMPLIESLNITDSDENPVLYQFMPLAGFGNGEVLTQYLQESTDTLLRDKILIHVMKSLLTACSGMHSRHIYHNDLKPSNFVIDQKGKVFIIDFGCAVESTKPMMNSVIGDTGYFSPDRLLAYKQKHQFNAAQSDAWALGITMLEIMLGSYPFDKDTADLRVRLWNAAYFQDKLKEIPELQNSAADSIWFLIKGLLETDPNKRLSVEAALQHPSLNETALQFASEDEISVSFKLLQGSQVEDSKAPVVPTKSIPKDQNSAYIHPDAIVNNALYNSINTSATIDETLQPSPYPIGNDNTNNSASMQQRDAVSSKALRTSGTFAKTSRAAANESKINRYSHTQTDLQQKTAMNMQQN